jgi:hypothetical protein
MELETSDDVRFSGDAVVLERTWSGRSQSRVTHLLVAQSSLYTRTDMGTGRRTEYWPLEPLRGATGGKESEVTLAGALRSRCRAGWKAVSSRRLGTG